MTKKSYKVTGMHCTSCAVVLESDLEDIGIKATCNYAKGVLDVEFDESRISEDTIYTVVRSSGYNLT